ncbi:unnamed protein product [Protopolystoma xenopodis]|uniref:Uncharacterized protein n=1 Tax=Protopolystoma xenopodis TaxID=117903 RepID=A0A3S5CT22_9PLAT|nr:unnamed protein product [Protopolystoma xenopodis]
MARKRVFSAHSSYPLSVASSEPARIHTLPFVRPAVETESVGVLSPPQSPPRPSPSLRRLRVASSPQTPPRRRPPTPGLILPNPSPATSFAPSVCATSTPHLLTQHRAPTRLPSPPSLACLPCRRSPPATV